MGTLSDDAIIPTKTAILHLHGVAGWITAGSMFCAALVLLAVVVDHVDRRNNEAASQRFGRWMSRTGWMLIRRGMGVHTAGINYPWPSAITATGIVGGMFSRPTRLFHPQHRQQPVRQPAWTGASPEFCSWRLEPWYSSGFLQDLLSSRQYSSSWRLSQPLSWSPEGFCTPGIGSPDRTDRFYRASTET